MLSSARRNVSSRSFGRSIDRWLYACIAGAICIACPTATAVASPAPVTQVQAAKLNNLGTALMNQQKFGDAADKFDAAYRSDSTMIVAEVNRGIALLYLGKEAEAEKAFQDVVSKDPQNASAWYCLGLLHLRTGAPADAMKDFERVQAIHPSDPDVLYMLGRAASQLGDYPKAITEFEAALQVDKNKASAEYGLATALQHSGKTVEARAHLKRFQQLMVEKISPPFADVYGEAGHFSLVDTVKSADAQVGAMIPVTFAARAVEGGAQSSTASANIAGGAVCILDLSGVAKTEMASMDFVALSSGTDAIHPFKNDGEGNFKRMSSAEMGLTANGTALACSVGDFNHDGLPDLAVAFTDRVVLFKNLGDGKFSDVTQAVGITPVNEPTALTFVDYDHDGDLDLLVTGRPATPGSSPNVLWRNNGNSTFTNWTAETGLGGKDPTAGVELSDVNNDRAVDLITTGMGNAPTLYLNPREGVFPSSPLYTDAGLPPTRGIYVLDFNKDGWMDIAVTHDGAPGVTLWRNVEGKRFERVPLPLQDATGGWGVTAIDVDNDGWLDLAVLVDTAHGPQLRVLRNLGAKGFSDITSALHLDQTRLHAPRTLIAADVDRNGAADFVIGQAQGDPLVLLNHGGNKNHSLQIRLRGEADNKSAIGTKIEVFAGGLWQKWEVAGASGYLGQGSREILAGLGQTDKADIVRLLWPTGVPQDELDVAANKPIKLVELDRRGSSCPTLFAWDGHKYQFVSDVIGAAVVGHWISPTQRNTPDPDEWIKIDGSQLHVYKGRFSLRFGEPMEEVNYIDQVRLIAVDHPAGTDANVNERFLSEPPFAQGNILLTSTAHLPAGAWDDSGHSVMEQLRYRDQNYVRNFTNLPYDGFAKMHTLTLDLGAWSPQYPLHLLLHGFVNYFSASSMYAAWQAGLHPVPPYVEAQLANGSWQRVMDDMGFPAGSTRTITVDLTGKLPPGTHRIRMVTNLQIYWDQILVANEPDASQQIRTTALPLRYAELAFRGYPQQLEGKTTGDVTYDYNHISQTGPFIRQQGEYTRYGAVTPLLRHVDDQFVIFGSGEDMDLEFSAETLPVLPAGWKRDYFFYANGYVKDMDFYEASPFTVTGMPFHKMTGYPYPASEHYPADTKRVGYQLDWNSRYESGTHPRPYEFHYVPRNMVPPATLPTSPSVTGAGLQ